MMSYLLKAILGVSGVLVATAVVVMVLTIGILDKHLPDRPKQIIMRICTIIAFVWMVQMLCLIYHFVYSFLVR